MTKGERIKKLRLEKGISQTELAERIGQSKQTVYKYENNIVTNIPSDVIEKIAISLDTTLSYLFGWDDNPETKSSEPPARDPLERFNSLSPKQQELFKLLLELTPDQAEEVVRYARFLKSHHE